MQNNNSKLNTVLLIVLILVIIFFGWKMTINKDINKDVIVDLPTDQANDNQNTKQNNPEVVQTPTPIPSPTPTPIPTTPITVIHAKYKNGAIAECTYNGSMVYKATVNAYDGGSVVYNLNAVQIGLTGYFPTQPSNYINENSLKNCRDVYVVSQNIWGKAGVNVYNL